MKAFQPYPYQVIISELLDRHSNVLIIKSRQMGISQMILGKFLHRAAQNPAYSAIGFFRNSGDAGAIALRVRQMTRSLSGLFSMERDNSGYMRIANGGEIYFKNSSKEGSRSYDSVSDFLFDEAAFSPNIGDIFAASSPSSALVAQTSKIVVSTPRLRQGWFWERLNENNGSVDIESLCAEVASGTRYLEIPGLLYFKDKGGLLKIILHWRAHPVYSQSEDYLKKRLDEDRTPWSTILREYDLKFIETRSPLFSEESVNKSINSFQLEKSLKSKFFGGIAFCGQSPVFTIWLCEESCCSMVFFYDGSNNSLETNLISIGDGLLKFVPTRIMIETGKGLGKFYKELIFFKYMYPNIDLVNWNNAEATAGLAKFQYALEQSHLTYPNDNQFIDELIRFPADFNAETVTGGGLVVSSTLALFTVDRKKHAIPLMDSFKNNQVKHPYTIGTLGYPPPYSNSVKPL